MKEYKLLNITQHVASTEQLERSIEFSYEDVGSIQTVEPTPEDKARIRELLTFKTINDCSDHKMRGRAVSLAEIVKKYPVNGALIGGAPYFMSVLESVLKHSRYDLMPAYSWSVRESKELPDGKKISVFKHAGYILKD